ncbi:hypothetical protein B5M47_03860 [candidate division CPR3 bacterium 4484_211]|uniref:Uncharacterized protein n=1 Tax=candidate division CPR3 bacterium 4484_211 TaxID=1968527 RepID=A0A1W9NW32_UNCC3|nr:MAG: hypothetical protein B5M47_03860 [candidate division CPR3 bacterium 4484_211]RLD03905.1 MAG: hypothetical protein DRI56_11850 [Chloroflexota bacterium]
MPNPVVIVIMTMAKHQMTNKFRIQNPESRIQITETFPCLEFGKLSFGHCLKFVIWIWFDIGHFYLTFYEFAPSQGQGPARKTSASRLSLEVMPRLWRYFTGNLTRKPVRSGELIYFLFE